MDHAATPPTSEQGDPASALSPSPPTLPNARQRPFDPPDELTRWEEAPIRRMTFADGHVGWLVTGHSAVRSVLADPRFSRQVEHAPLGERRASRDTAPTPPGFFLAMDPPEHTRYRKLLTGQFTVRRMRQLESRIDQIVTEHLDAMGSAGPPTDLVQAFALPVPSLVICELLGVPYADRADFQRDSAAVISIETSAEDTQAALYRLIAYLADLTANKRADPTDDIVGGLAAVQELTEAEIAGMAALLLVAGHETTANMLGLGTFALLRNPDQLRAIRDADAAGTVDAAVEELLRYLSVVFVVPRVALEDLELAGVEIKAGEPVALSLSAGNRDPERFSAPDDLAIANGQAGHLAFGHGIHQCLGQQLARIEMRLGLPALLRRFPDLRLAVAPAEVPMRSDMVIYGVHRLPVTW